MANLKLEQNHLQFQYESPIRYASMHQTPPKKQTENSCNFQSTKDKIRLLSFKKFRKSVWTKEEDQLLKAKVEEKGPVQWASIATFLPNRSGKQCRERWHNHLRQGVTKKAWDLNQFWILALCVRAFGKKWSAISEFIPGRSDNTIKNQWNCKMKPYKHHFDTKIDELLQTPQLWHTVSNNEQMLLIKISKKQPQNQVQQNQEINKILEEYCAIIEAGLSEYCYAKEELSLQNDQVKENDQVEDNAKEDEGEVQPGDLSAAISAGDCMFWESEEENPIIPQCLF